MRYKTVKDVVEHTRNLHHQIGEFYQKLSNDNCQERVKMLLDHLTRHEEHFEQVLLKFEQDESQKIWDEWFQYAPEHKLDEILEDVDLSNDMGTNEVVVLALKVDDYFIELYRDMAANAASGAVKDVFENLLVMEEKEKIRTARSALEVYDM